MSSDIKIIKNNHIDKRNMDGISNNEPQPISEYPFDLTRWSTSLEILLDDSEGVELFNRFLSIKYSAGHLLDFWFACKGFRTNIDLSDPEKLFQIAKVIYRTYVKQGALNAVPIPKIIKQQINEYMNAYHHGSKNYITGARHCHVQMPDRCIFDSAQDNIKHILEQKYYPEFIQLMESPSELKKLTCDLPIALDLKIKPKHINLSDTEIHSNNNQIGNYSARSRLLTRLKLHGYRNRFSVDHSPITKANCDFSVDSYHINSNSNNYEQIPNNMVNLHSTNRSTSLTNSAITSTTTMVSSTTITEVNNNKAQISSSCSNSNGPLNSIQPIVSPLLLPQPTTSSPSSKTAHTNRLDLNLSDELQNQMKSTNTVPMLLENPDKFDHSINLNSIKADDVGDKLNKTGEVNNSHKVQSQIFCEQVNSPPNLIKTNLSQKTSKNQFNPVKKQTNLAESDPASFVLLLTSRLEKVKESRGKVEKLMSWVNQVDEKTTGEYMPHSPVIQRQLSTQLDTIIHPSYKLLDENLQDKHNNNNNNNNNVLKNQNLHDGNLCESDNLKYVCIPDNLLHIHHKHRHNLTQEEDAQGILDDHCSRIWADEIDPNTYRNKKCNELNQTPSSQPSLTAYPYLSDTLVHSMHASLSRSGSQSIDHEHKRKLNTRRRTAVSAMSSLPHTNSTKFEEHTHKYNNSSLRNANYKPNRSDARSTASWDSGVVANLTLNELKNPFYSDNYYDLETNSILQSASLQALSSSTTELALVNGEVTAKLVEQMIKHYPHQYLNQTKYLSHNSSGNPVHPHYYHHHHHEYRNTENPSNNSNSYAHFNPTCLNHISDSNYDDILSNSSSKQSTQCFTQDSKEIAIKNENCCCSNHHHHHHSNINDYSQLITGSVWNSRMDNNSNRSQNFPTASDTSSTFDSGISSTYDQLPLRIRKANKRDNRSQSLHNWQANADIKESNPTVRRAPSAPKPQCTTTSGHEFESFKNSPNLTHCSTNCHICYNKECNNSVQTSVINCGTLCVHCSNKSTDKSGNYEKCESHSLSIPNTTGFNVKRSGGKLLQHWLELQSETSKNLNSQSQPNPDQYCNTSNQIKSSKEYHTYVRKPHHHHHHHHRRSNVQKANHSKQFSQSNPNSDLVERYNDKNLSPLVDINSNGIPSSVGSTGIVVGYYLCDDPVPYRTIWTGCSVSIAHNTTNNGIDNIISSSSTQPTLTLGQFKQLIAKKGVYRYFFKKQSDEFGTGVVHEELTNDNSLLPLWDGKVVARIERAD